MKKTGFIISALAVFFCFGFFSRTIFTSQGDLNTGIEQAAHNLKKVNSIKLGAFSMSLSVKDLAVSKQFYENLGFVEFGGGMEKNYLIMKNGNALIGLFQGMFTGNILTFNPGWDENAQNVDPFDDVRTIQKQLKNKGITINPEVDEKTTGPAGFMITDPDGNGVLIDQHR